MILKQNKKIHPLPNMDKGELCKLLYLRNYRNIMHKKQNGFLCNILTFYLLRIAPCAPEETNFW